MDELSIEQALSFLGSEVTRVSGFSNIDAIHELYSGLTDETLSAVVRVAIAPDHPDSKYAGRILPDTGWWAGARIALQDGDGEWRQWFMRDGFRVSRKSIDDRVNQLNHRFQIELEKSRDIEMPEKWDLNEALIWITTRNKAYVSQVREGWNAVGGVRTGRQSLDRVLSGEPGDDNVATSLLPHWLKLHSVLSAHKLVARVYRARISDWPAISADEFALSNFDFRSPTYGLLRSAWGNVCIVFDASEIIANWPIEKRAPRAKAKSGRDYPADDQLIAAHKKLLKETDSMGSREATDSVLKLKGYEKTPVTYLRSLVEGRGATRGRRKKSG